MNLFWIILFILFGICLLFAIILYGCFLLTFYSFKRRETGVDEYPLPKGAVYEPFYPAMIGWMKETRQMASEDFSIRSHDGLTLRGKYYEHTKNSPIEIMFPGYRGTAERDLCGAAQRCHKLGHSAFIVDQRAGGRSDGHVISFGINESKDCLAWVDFVIEYFGPDVKIILTGISMGAATVMLAAGHLLPKNVIGVLADCGYSSASDIIKKVIGDLHLPSSIVYPLVRWAGKIYGGFDVEKSDVLSSVKKATVPIIFIHGESDDFIPHEMSKLLYENCNTKKCFLSVPGAGHGLAYPMDPDDYIAKVQKFWQG